MWQVQRPAGGRGALGRGVQAAGGGGGGEGQAPVARDRASVGRVGLEDRSAPGTPRELRLAMSMLNPKPVWLLMEGSRCQGVCQRRTLH